MILADFCLSVGVDIVQNVVVLPLVSAVAAVADAVVDAAGRNDGDAGVTESQNSRNLAPILTFFSKFDYKSNGLRLSHYFLSLCTYLLPYLKNPASFCLFSFFSHDKYRTNFTINGKSTDGVLGTQTQGGRMVSVGADKSAELWRHPCVLSSFMSFQLLLCPIPRNF